MYTNIGAKKSKGLAIVVCIGGIIAGVIAGLALISFDEDLALIAILLIAVAALISWVSSFWFCTDSASLWKTAVKSPTGKLRSRIPVPRRLIRKNRDLTELHKLRMQGIITEEEYQKNLRREADMNKKLVFYPEKMTWVCVLLGIAVIARISLNAYIMFFSEQKASAYDYAMMLNGFLLPVVPFVITLIIINRSQNCYLGNYFKALFLCEAVLSLVQNSLYCADILLIMGKFGRLSGIFTV